jgi:hypothetical protein
MTPGALPSLLRIDREIDQVIDRIVLCGNMKSDEKRARATTRAHEELRLLEGVRRSLVLDVFPEILEEIHGRVRQPTA